MSWPSRKIVAHDLDRVADGALDRVAAAVELRARRPGSGSGRRFLGGGRGHGVDFYQRTRSGKQRHDERSTIQRRRCCIRPRFPAARLGAGGVRASSTGSPRPASRWWQVLPLGPPDDVGSPYALRVGLRGLARAARASPTRRSTREEATAFRERERATGSRTGARFAGEDALDDQVRFDREWRALRAYAAERGVRLIGDVPIYVAPGERRPRARTRSSSVAALVAGAPPDPLGPAGAALGQPALRLGRAGARDGYRWWIERLRRTFELFDLTRIDHFRGFAQYWAVPEGAATARRGRWREGPRAAVFRAAEAELGPLPVIAEDLGVITPDVVALRERARLPGDGRRSSSPSTGAPDNPHRPREPREEQPSSTPARTTPTPRAAGGTRSPRRSARAPASTRPSRLVADRARATRRGRELAIVQAQDVLGLGSEARMNRPGTAHGNWRWRLEPGQLTREHALRLRALAERYAR